MTRLTDRSYVQTHISGITELTPGFGINLTDTTNTMIAGTKAGAGNVILTNVDIQSSTGGPGTAGTVIQGDYIGVDATGSVGLGDGRQTCFTRPSEPACNW
jgi:hypothetical protein